MPTKKKRVGFIPRDNVMKIICKLSYENNLSNSKIISLLVEEALAKRGIYNVEGENERLSLISKNEVIESLSSELKDDNKKILTEELSNRITNNKNSYDCDYFDKGTYEKFLMFVKFTEMINKYES